MLWGVELNEVADPFIPYLVELNELTASHMVFSYFRNSTPTIAIGTELCAIEFVDVIYNTIAYDCHIFFSFSVTKSLLLWSVCHLLLNWLSNDLMFSLLISKHVITPICLLFYLLLLV